MTTSGTSPRPAAPAEPRSAVKVATTTGVRFAQRLSPSSRSGSLGWLLVVGFLLHVALRLAISLGRDGPVNFADETGYLANTRVMSGGVIGQLGLASFYRGGYSLLLPAYWLGNGPQSQYHFVLATNALLSSLVFPLLYVMLTRVFAVPVRAARIAAFLAALYPPLVVTTQYAWAESLLPVLALVAAVTLGAVVTARQLELPRGGRSRAVAVPARCTQRTAGPRRWCCCCSGCCWCLRCSVMTWRSAQPLGWWRPWWWRWQGKGWTAG